MSEIRNELTAAPEGVGERWAAALVRRYPGGHRAKRIATDFVCEVRTAQSWLGGQPPQVAALARAGLRFGPTLVLEVLLPGSDAADAARVRSDLDEMTRRLDELRAAIERRRDG